MNPDARELLKRFENTLRAMGYSNRQIQDIMTPVNAMCEELEADLAQLLQPVLEAEHCLNIPA